MQKVSKQSLAMLALSILLAISIALTFTFAALTSVNKTATGKITFSGEYAVAWSGGTSNDVSGNSNGMEFTLNETLFEVTASNGLLAATLDAENEALEAYKVKFTNATATATTYSIEFAQEATTTGTITAKLADDKKSGTVPANQSVEVNLKELIETFSIANATGAEITFTLKATIGA